MIYRHLTIYIICENFRIVPNDYVSQVNTVRAIDKFGFVITHQSLTSAYVVGDQKMIPLHNLNIFRTKIKIYLEIGSGISFCVIS